MSWLTTPLPAYGLAAQWALQEAQALDRTRARLEAFLAAQWADRETQALDRTRARLGAFLTPADGPTIEGHITPAGLVS